MERDDTPLWYFAYGSNLDPETFLGRRRMRPLACERAQLAGFQLVFDLPFGRGERGFANLREAPGESVWGVAYRIGSAQSQHLDRTEGVPRAYRRHAVTINPAVGDPLPAFTYVSPLRAPHRKPSRRYMGLLLRGARHHGLPEPWIAFLRGFELAADERSTQGQLFERERGRR